MVRSDIFKEICGKSSPMEFPSALGSLLQAILPLMCSEVVEQAGFTSNQESHSSWPAMDSSGVVWMQLDSNAQRWTNEAARGMHTALVGHMSHQPAQRLFLASVAALMRSTSSAW